MALRFFRFFLENKVDLKGMHYYKRNGKCESNLV
jgi:hypothetical protein